LGVASSEGEGRGLCAAADGVDLARLVALVLPQATSPLTANNPTRALTTT
jgi:hypothetical protein